MSDHCPGADDASLADGDAGQKNGAGSNIGPCLHMHRANLQCGFDDGPIRRYPSVGGAQNLGSWPPAHMVFQYEMTRIHIRLRPDPDMSADFCDAIEAPLNIGLGSEEDSVPDLKGFQVLESHPAANPNTVAKCAREGSPDGSPHHVVQCAVPVCKPGILFQQCVLGIVRPKMAGEVHLKGRIWFDLMIAVDGAHGASFACKDGIHNEVESAG